MNIIFEWPTAMISTLVSATVIGFYCFSFSVKSKFDDASEDFKYTTLLYPPLIFLFLMYYLFNLITTIYLDMIKA